MAKKILVVDDELKIVQQAGFSVLTASNGKDALTLWKVEQPALVVLDLMLPDMDGFDVAREIRKRSNTPIIMLTARVEDADRIAGLEIGADDYVVKPFNPRELVARVRAVLRRVEGFTKPAVIEAEQRLLVNQGASSRGFSSSRPSPGRPMPPLTAPLIRTSRTCARRSNLTHKTHSIS
jgi:DNA-binding response OmpR family regulator